MHAMKDVEGLTKGITFEGKMTFKYRKFALVEIGNFKAACDLKDGCGVLVSVVEDAL